MSKWTTLATAAANLAAATATDKTSCKKSNWLPMLRRKSLVVLLRGDIMPVKLRAVVVAARGLFL
jgi:hypothetical protein